MDFFSIRTEKQIFKENAKRFSTKDAFILSSDGTRFQKRRFEKNAV